VIEGQLCFGRAIAFANFDPMVFSGAEQDLTDARAAASDHGDNGWRLDATVRQICSEGVVCYRREK
jgi:hypothetical protein